MTRLADIEGHIASMRELLNLVGAMRSLAGMRMQEAQRALPGIRHYAESLTTALASTLMLMPEPEPRQHRNPRARLALVLCTSEHGFVGGFNEQLVGAAEATLAGDDLVFVLGGRGTVLFYERGRPATWAHAMATRCSAAPETVRHLSEELYRRIASNEIARVDVMYSRHHQGGVSTQGSVSTTLRRKLLPVDIASLKTRQLRQPPLHNLDPARLYESLLGQYVFALLTEAAVESIASENAARFAAMESAHDNVSTKLNRLRHEAHQARQTEITTELIELVGGAEAQRIK
jgi:F-type H+-transporting ATPase subunit gamma